MPTTSQIQKAFWTKLKESKPELFNGTPSGYYYFNINVKGKSYIKIRLNIYLTPSEFKINGPQTVSLVIPAGKCKQINDLFENDCKAIKNDCVVIWYKNAGIKDMIPEDPIKWQPYIDWFVKYTQKLKDLLESWK